MSYSQLSVSAVVASPMTQQQQQGQHDAAYHCARCLSAESSIALCPVLVSTEQQQRRVALHLVPVLSLASLLTHVYQIENHPELFDVTDHLPNTSHSYHAVAEVSHKRDRESENEHERSWVLEFR